MPWKLLLPQMVTARIGGGEHLVQAIDLDPMTRAIRVAYPPTEPDGSMIQKTEVQPGDYWPEVNDDG